MQPPYNMKLPALRTKQKDEGLQVVKGWTNRRYTERNVTSTALFLIRLKWGIIRLHSNDACFCQLFKITVATQYDT